MKKLLLSFLLIIASTALLTAQDCTPTTSINANDFPYTQTVNTCNLTNDFTQTNVCPLPNAAPSALGPRNDYLLEIEVDESACFNLSIVPNLEVTPGLDFLFVYVLSDCPDNSPDCIFRQFPTSSNNTQWDSNSTVTPISLPAEGTYYIWVSGGVNPQCGEFEIELTPATEGCATCDDGIQNGLEEGVDCGGPFCPPCLEADFLISQGGSYEVCDVLFADSGNSTGNYGILENHTITFCPDEDDTCIEAVFSQIDIRNGDFLRVYAGTNTNAPLLATYTNTQVLPDDILSPTGCLTFQFTSNASATGAGWLANLNCAECPPASEFVMGNLGTIESCEGGVFTDSGDIYLGYGANENLSFTYCSDDETQCPTLSFSEMNLLTGARLRIYNGTDFTSPIIADITGNLVPGELVATSGCMTFRFTSDANSVGGTGWVGNLSCAPCPEDADYIMQNGSITTCEAGTFTDSGGLFSGYLGGENLVYTYCSADDDLCPNVDFNSLNLLPGATLRIYDGTDINAPLMETLTGNAAPANVLQSSTGCLTFRFTSNNASIGGSGWAADLFCGPCATCDDGIQNGFESGVDCGGPCEPCPEIFINEGGVVYTCNSSFYDTGGPDGNYGPNQNHTIVICPGANAEEGEVTTVLFEQFQLVNNTDRLIVRNGMNATSPLLQLPGLTQPAAGFTGTQLAGELIQASLDGNETGCLRFTFTSGAFSNQPGWIGQVSCALPCQPFTFGISVNDDLVDGVYELCGTINFDVTADFPFNGTVYDQNVPGLTINSRVGGLNFQNTGSSNHTLALDGAANFNPRTLTFTATDNNGCPSSNEVTVEIRQIINAPTREYSYTGLNSDGELITINNENHLDDVEFCQGTEIFIDYSVTPNPLILPLFFETLTTLALTDTQGVIFESNNVISGYSPELVIGGNTFLVEMCINATHTYMGDLNIRLRCPNGTIVPIHNSPWVSLAAGGGGTDLGIPPNTGFDYCWNMSETQTMAEVAIPIPGGNLPAGSFLPQNGNFADFAGCPLNGTWTLMISDHFASDSGTLFNFTLEFETTDVNDPNITVFPEITSEEVFYEDVNYFPEPMLFKANESGFLFFTNTTTLNYENIVSSCDYTDSLRINVVACDVIVPNIITPNSDGANDGWIIDGDLTRITRVLILNRWGRIVYESSTYDNSAPFDGKSNGSDLPEGTYFYIVEMDGQDPLKGTLTIVR
jgi:gliding motility-associated-like protein